MNEHALFSLLDLSGTFVFAISGAAAARQRGLDLFGIIAIAFVTACGGGIARDICIGATPPAALDNWRYLVLAIAGALAAIGADAWLNRLNQPVLLFDALGLSIFTVAGTQKVLFSGHNAEAAIVLGMISAVGGGMARDVLLNRLPVILQREIYASAALAGAAFVIAAHHFGWSPAWSTWPGIAACFVLRYLALRYRWNLPRFNPRQDGATP